MPDGRGRREELGLRVTPLQKALFVFAHQDDEFGVLGRMIQLKEKAVDITAVWTTGDNRRVAETAEAMDLVGIRNDRRFTLSCGGLANAASVRKAVESLTALMRARQFDEIYVVAFEGGHCQHDLTQFVVVQAARAADFAGQIYEFPLYNLAGWLNLFEPVPAAVPTIQMSLTTERMDFIQSLTRCYPSQAPVTMGFKLAIPTRRKLHPIFRPLPAWDYTRPPHSGRVWHDANLRHPFAKPYRDGVLSVVKEYYHLFGAPQPTGIVCEQDKNPEARKLAQRVLATD
ncbi:MAG: hypothetical protein N2689_10495 [Verrucomicrobiae bacterium]|nr:hypothetical protein [Verrucomicrobiae bacterium]